jgi:hypothetical protein
MANLQSLIDEISDIVKDRSYDIPGVAPQGTITVSVGLPTAGETITIYNQEFEFVVLRSGAGEITIGASEDECVVNIALAINTDLDVVTAESDVSTDTVVVTSVYQGPSWEKIVFSEDATNVVMDGDGYLGGTASGVYGDRIKKLINRGILEVCERVALPGLRTSSDVVTSLSCSYVALPSDFLRDFDRCHSSTNERNVKIRQSLSVLGDEFYDTWDSSGDVESVACDANYLHYQKIPTSVETLKMYYLSKPTMLSSMDDVPDYIPNNHQSDLLVNYAVKEMYTQIENGLDGKMPNTIKYTGLYETAIKKLVGYLNSISRPKWRKPKGQWI